jgi:hypothetical protein
MGTNLPSSLVRSSSRHAAGQHVFSSFYYDSKGREKTGGKQSIKNDYLFDKKKLNFFPLFFCSWAKKSLFITRAPTPSPALVIKQLFLALEKKPVKTLFFIGHNFFFYEFASAIEQCTNPSESPACCNLEGI